jgi:hypothetical protein
MGYATQSLVYYLERPFSRITYLRYFQGVALMLMVSDLRLQNSKIILKTMTTSPETVPLK